MEEKKMTGAEIKAMKTALVIGELAREGNDAVAVFIARDGNVTVLDIFDTDTGPEGRAKAIVALRTEMEGVIRQMDAKMAQTFNLRFDYNAKDQTGQYVPMAGSAASTETVQ